ncbi:DUF4145 domain-containing protein [uncultured Arcticibacterium sp.]|uniref:DUF4145 domain-containing protein n=1 Tax=uncultured Arcticibacterium sp. TaxID=2173042 RepID=UPI0030F963F9
MQRIEEKYISQKTETRGYIHVYSIDYFCPKCFRNVNFVLNWSQNSNDICMCAKSKCPGCNEFLKFIYIDYELEKGKLGKLYIHPDSNNRTSIVSANHEESNLNEALLMAYESAINVYNIGEWVGTAVLCRRLLEGISKDLIPNLSNKATLYNSLKDLPNHIDLQEPILTLAEALRKGGNLGAHFDLVKTPDKRIATQMLDLLDYLIEYIYLLPDRIEMLHREIENLENTN